jgi:hypothetical protein
MTSIPIINAGLRLFRLIFLVSLLLTGTAPVLRGQHAPRTAFIQDIAVDSTDPDDEADTEPSIAVNPQNPNEIAVVAFSGRWDPDDAGTNGSRVEVQGWREKLEEGVSNTSPGRWSSRTLGPKDRIRSARILEYNRTRHN